MVSSQHLYVDFISNYCLYFKTSTFTIFILKQARLQYRYPDRIRIVGRRPKKILKEDIEFNSVKDHSNSTSPATSPDISREPSEDANVSLDITDSLSAESTEDDDSKPTNHGKTDFLPFSYMSEH